MKKSFTLIELIFVIVIIGFLASIAVPKFMQTKASASTSSAVGIVSSIRTAIETKHGEWIINDDLNSSNGYTPQGYPQQLDDADVNKSAQRLFDGDDTLPLLKKGVYSCSPSSGSDCWYKDKNKTDENISDYIYKFNNDDYIKLEYNGSNGKFQCVNSNSKNKTECESIIK